MIILGIESSCDETAAALVRDGRHVLSSVVASQVAVHHRYGGVVPELASRQHIEAIDAVMREALSQSRLELADVRGIAVTRGPGLIGSLLVGFSFAKAMAYALGVPWVGVNHLEAHIHALFLEDRPPEFPFVVLLTSGGHTGLYYVTSFVSMEMLGQTRDDAAGEAFDKVAKLMQLGYPGGVRIEALAARGNPAAFSLPRPRIAAEPLTFSFSGLKTAVALQLKKHPEILADPGTQADLAASFQEAVVDSLTSRAWLALKQTGLHRLVVCGGVAANGYLRRVLQDRAGAASAELFLPPLHLCGDNAAMVAALGFHLLAAGQRLDLDADVFSRG